MNFLRWLFQAQVPVIGSVLILREVPGNISGLAPALGGMRRRVWAASKMTVSTVAVPDVGVMA
ncbi:hypothetical protein GCM10009825_39180 [Arthrobacter humicola]|uniref:Uncharacterized protein n=1 Tax=Arthrobacter humicola TaxID=409291 RepID=A0ABP5LKD4_9MICC